MFRAAAVALALTACSPARTIDGARSAAVFDRIALDTAGVHGLSGLAVDGDGALWTVAERGEVAFRVELEGQTVRSITRFPVEGVPGGEDLESVAWSDGTFWIGTEGQDHGRVHAYQLELDRARGVLRVTAPYEITSDDAGLRLAANHGAEGVCVAGDLLGIAIEETATDRHGRWAPVVTIDRRTGARVVHRLRLTSKTGKLSALDCWRDGARVRAIAIERHFGVTRILGFDLGPVAGEVTPEVMLDLGPILRGALNLEGVVRLADGRVVAVVDNQYGRITGPDELLMFKPERLALPPAR